MEYIPYHAYLDKKNVLTIISEYETSFFINNTFCNSTLQSKSDSLFIYKVSYEIDLNKQYYISDLLNQQYVLLIRYIVKENWFDETYFYEKDDLGATYNKECTTFKLWAPIASKVLLCYNNHEIEMQKSNNGVFFKTINEDLKNVFYHYKIMNNQQEAICPDPYSYSFNANSKESVVIDLNDFQIDDFILPPLKNDQIIIYELSVRDFSMDGSLGNDVKGKFNAFLKNEATLKNFPIGINYLKQLGITHVQLMPILDFATVDELNPTTNYNWGYDPISYNAIEGSFCTNPNDPTNRIVEAKKMIENFHQNQIRVVLDVVFNHTYYFKESIFQKIIPNYFYLMDFNGNLSNGSFCGNDIDTTKKMVQKYFLDMCIRYVKFYKIDGLRFDLMGILSKDLILKIKEECCKINPDFIIYGEGWNMPSMLNENLRTSLNNAKSLPQISFFNDYFRDTLSGKIHQSRYLLGYLNQNTSLAFQFINAMRGSVDNDCYFDKASSSINYIECHDNYTLYDKLKITNPTLSETQRNDLQLCMIAAIIFAQGIPFLHCGIEFNRSKNGVENSYNSPDLINQINWENTVKYYKNVKALRDFIDIRKKEKCFHYIEKKDIFKFIDGKVIDNCATLLTYIYDGKVLLLIFNPSNKKIKIPINGDFKLIANQYGYLNKSQDISNHVFIKPFQVLILKK